MKYLGAQHFWRPELRNGITSDGDEPCVTKEAVTSVRLRPLCRQMRLAVDSNEGAWENVWPTKNRRWEGVVDFLKL